MGWLLAAAAVTPSTPATASPVPYRDELPSRWRYTLVFRPADVPLPKSVHDENGIPSPTARVRAVYSPSVIRVGHQYLMVFGVSLYCQSGRVARDSIALARSTDGLHFEFVRYLLEPSPLACTIPVHRWRQYAPFTFQVNDPTFHHHPRHPGRLLVLYTSVTSDRDHFGHLGLATFDRQLRRPLHRNDTWIRGQRARRFAPAPTPFMGLSRPSLSLGEPGGGPHLWFDSQFHVGHIEAPDLRARRSPGLPGPITWEGVRAGDVQVPYLDPDRQLLLANGSRGILARSRSLIRGTYSAWSPPWELTSVGNHRAAEAPWDTWYHGSPELFVDDDACTIRLYFSAAVQDPDSPRTPINHIAVAEPEPRRVFHFARCVGDPRPEWRRLLQPRPGTQPLRPAGG